MYTGLPCCWIKRGTQHVLKCFATWNRIDDDFSWAVILLGLKVKVFVGVDPERLSICAGTAGIKREWNQKRAADMGEYLASWDKVYPLVLMRIHSFYISNRCYIICSLKTLIGSFVENERGL